ncbi:MAG: carbon starvation CstA 5TM domain-containing protein, partial [Candidatus Saccharicenans sp.]|nr:carbon starvation CstA 5TM domain-containing protein [Candidatus Saccharicenans sp.]
NQLLAALTLFAVSAWLLLRRRSNWFTLAPGIFMLLTTMASLLILMRSYLEKKNYVLLMADLLLLGLAVGVIFLFIRTFSRRRTGKTVEA